MLSHQEVTFEKDLKLEASWTVRKTQTRGEAETCEVPQVSRSGEGSLVDDMDGLRLHTG